jgi:dTDP-4-dehydrorhamnose 3,5-epimerase
LEPIKDSQTVTPAGELVGPRIDGVQIRYAKTIEDERGEICEIYDPRWGFTTDPVVYVYQAMIRPGCAKGWIVHRNQDDRLFINLGSAKVVLYDERDGSTTRAALDVIYLGERGRGIVTIPRGVWHAVQNVGEHDMYYVNMPTAPYNHEDPDKFRLPLSTDRIPYSFEGVSGW